MVLKNKLQFLTFPFFFMVELQNFLNAARNYLIRQYLLQFMAINIKIRAVQY